MRLAAGLALLTLALVSFGGAARTQNLGILDATLAEPHQKTGEVSTADLRRILADNSAIVLDTRTQSEFDAGHIFQGRTAAFICHQAIFSVREHAMGRREHEIGCNGDAGAQAARAHDQHHLSGDGYIRQRRTAYHGGGGRRQRDQRRERCEQVPRCVPGAAGNRDAQPITAAAAAAGRALSVGKTCARLH